MRIYVAPMEGMTGYVFRNVYEKNFGKGRIDKYFIPFISPNQSNGYTKRERDDIEVSHNAGIRAVPQIMANEAKYFERAVVMLKEMGYDEINLNFGCPSGTVVSKHKGAGILAFPDELDKFLEAAVAISDSNHMKLSVKTRIGMNSPQELHYLLTIYNQYPLSELIVHPRVREDYYNNTPDLKAFEEVMNESVNPVCYNGDIFTRTDYIRLCKMFPKLDAVMLGRGLVGDPALLDALKSDNPENYSRDIAADSEKIKAFHKELLEGYRHMFTEENAMHKMKEVWIYTKLHFQGGDKELKQIKKSRHIDEYNVAVNAFFKNAVLKQD